MRSKFLGAMTFGVGLSIVLTGCGTSGSSQSQGSAGGGGGTSCAPIAGKQLVILKDDKHLQQAENIVPAVNKKKSSPALLADLDKVSAALGSGALLALNKSTDVERNTSGTTAAAFVKQNNLTQGLKKGSGTVKVGYQGFSENETLADIYVDVLTAAGFDASAQKAGARPVYMPILEKGGLTVVPEYLGSLTQYFNQADNGASAPSLASGDVAKTLTSLTKIAGKHGVVVGKPAQAQDQNAFAVTRAFADKHGITTISGLVKACPSGIVLGGPAECNSPKQPQCAPGLERTYGLKISKFVPAGGAGSSQAKNYATTGRVTMVLVLSSDGTLTQA